MEETKFENGIVEENEVYDEVPEESSNGVLGKIILGVSAMAAVGVGALVYKNRDKIEKRRIAKLEKKGYIITKPETETDEEVSSEEN